ncbi:uncharacterized protein HKW66_Vig0209380 [Vigna angularis]|uniref:Uncharacterized protein n=1 Tax=Phaseolus angularis TaxID=3914 RepID=A0A8T0JI15_PHAAN|nr:uncharacterized protein HKW66_Vig0209380 [Vigna angularis]
MEAHELGFLVHKDLGFVFEMKGDFLGADFAMEEKIEDDGKVGGAAMVVASGFRGDVDGGGPRGEEDGCDGTNWWHSLKREIHDEVFYRLVALCDFWHDGLWQRMVELMVAGWSGEVVVGLMNIEDDTRKEKKRIKVSCGKDEADVTGSDEVTASLC